jgi:predicted O-methyltransferase YrrM
VIEAAVVTDWRRGHRQPGLTELAVCRQLRQLAALVPADQEIVELGAYAGRSTGWLLLGAQDGHGAHVTSVDPWDLRTDGYDRYSARYALAGKLYREHMVRIGASDRTLATRQGKATEVAADWYGPVGLLWHDAEHSAVAVARDLRAWLPHMAARSTIVLHDVALTRLGVLDGARQVLDAADWDWPGLVTLTWAKRPGLRGAAVIRRRG